MTSQPLKTNTGLPEKVILVAEDDDISFALLQVLLSKKNKLIRAKNGEEVLNVLRENPEIDLILMDLKMPVMDGYEATREIRKFNNEIPIIAQTAYALSGDDNKALEAGCNDYVSKPIKKEKLMEKVEKYLQHLNS